MIQEQIGDFYLYLNDALYSTNKLTKKLEFEIDDGVFLRVEHNDTLTKMTQ